MASERYGMELLIQPVLLRFEITGIVAAIAFLDSTNNILLHTQLSFDIPFLISSLTPSSQQRMMVHIARLQLPHRKRRKDITIKEMEGR